MPYGPVIAPRQDMAVIKGQKATRKMRRLYKREGAHAFASRICPVTLDAAVGEHYRDRAQLMSWAEFKASLFDHYDWQDANAVGAEHMPRLVYMKEVLRVLLAGSEGITPALEPLRHNLLDVGKLRTNWHALMYLSAVATAAAFVSLAVAGLLLVPKLLRLAKGADEVFSAFGYARPKDVDLYRSPKYTSEKITSL